MLSARVWSVLAVLCLSACAGKPPAATDVERQILAPTGVLRVGVYPGSPVSMVRDPASGQPKGISIGLGQALASRLNVPFQMVEFAKLTDVGDAVRESRVDVMVTNATATRAQSMDFSDPIVEIEQGYLVMGDSTLASAGEVDRAGVRVLVVQGSTSQASLPQKLTSASISVAPTIGAAKEMLMRHQADAFATQKSILYEVSDELPGSRILSGRYGVEQIAVGIAKGRGAGLPFLRRFAEESKADGSVARLIETVGMRGASVASARSSD